MEKTEQKPTANIPVRSEIILNRTMEHSAFDDELFDKRDMQALADIGGDVFDWTVTATEVSDTLFGEP